MKLDIFPFFGATAPKNGKIFAMALKSRPFCSRRRIYRFCAQEIERMTRDEIEKAIIHIFEDQFEIEDPKLDADLREVHEFDSIDAIELLREIELLLKVQLTRDEKKAAMDIRTIDQVVDYVVAMDNNHRNN
jgi:acyl carrier protein